MPEDRDRQQQDPAQGNEVKAREEASREREVLPVTQEEATVGVRKFETGRVRVATQVTTRTENLEEELTREDVEVRRVHVGREVDGPVPVREEGDTTIIPIMEEVLLVSKQLVLKEEVHVRRRTTRTKESRQVTLRRTEPVIERTAAEDPASEDEEDETK